MEEWRKKYRELLESQRYMSTPLAGMLEVQDMDYTDVGPAMAASAQNNRTRALETKVEVLEREIEELKEVIRNMVER